MTIEKIKNFKIFSGLYLIGISFSVEKLRNLKEWVRSTWKRYKIVSHLWTRTTISSSKKVFALRKTKSWIAIKGKIGGRKNYFLFVVDSCSGSLATLATATALPVPPAILIISYCSIALNFDFVLLVHFLGHPVEFTHLSCSSIKTVCLFST